MYGLAAGYIPYYSDFWSYPTWGIAWLVVSPFWREFHFIVYHRILHIQPLYRWFHAWHHKSYNTAVWSSLSFHWVEAVVYFSGPVMLVALPPLICGAGAALHPIHYLFANVHAEMASVYGHHGYDAYGGSYFHYLHHRLFECNYGTPFLPLDIWLGTWRTHLKSKARRAREAALAEGHLKASVASSEEHPEDSDTSSEPSSNGAGPKSQPRPRAQSRVRAVAR